jgi:hypothetical protein
MSCNVYTQTEWASILLSPFYVSSECTSTVGEKSASKGKNEGPPDIKGQVSRVGIRNHARFV